MAASSCARAAATSSGRPCSSPCSRACSWATCARGVYVGRARRQEVGQLGLGLRELRLGTSHLFRPRAVPHSLQLGLGLGHAGLCLPELRLLLGVVEAGERLARLHLVADADVHLGHAPAAAEGDLARLVGDHRARPVHAGRDRAAGHGDGLHRRSGRGGQSRVDDVPQDGAHHQRGQQAGQLRTAERRPSRAERPGPIDCYSTHLGSSWW